jgi:trans-aconitate methyltransferase
LLGQIFSLKSHFTWREILGNARAMRKARGPLRGYVTTLCFWALMEAGMLDALAGGEGLSCKEFAEARRLNPEILDDIVRYLHRMRYLKMDGDRASFSKKGRKFWSDVQGVFRLFYAYEPLFSSLGAQLRGEAAFQKDLFRHEAEVAQGFAELARHFMFPILQRIIAREGFHSLVDLGCAEIELSSYLCEHDAAMRCLGIDSSPEVLADAQRKIERMKLGARVHVLWADIFELDRVKEDFSEYELVTAVDLFHGYFLEGEERLLSLFQKMRKVFPQQRFLFSEICLPTHSAMRRVAYPYTEHELFHDLTRQKSFAAGQLEGLLKRSGYQIDKQWNYNQIAGRICLLCH